jgi:hypothetical protein
MRRHSRATRPQPSWLERLDRARLGRRGSSAYGPGQPRGVGAGAQHRVGGVAGGGEPGGFAESFLGGEAEQAQVAQQSGGLVGGDGVAIPLAVPALAANASARGVFRSP